LHAGPLVLPPRTGTGLFSGGKNSSAVVGRRARQLAGYLGDALSLVRRLECEIVVSQNG
jgi:hypothetical protein